MRLQEAIRLIFTRFRKLGAAQRVLLSLTDEKCTFRVPRTAKRLTPDHYRNVISLLKKPFYAGAYASDKNETGSIVVDRCVRKSYGHHQPFERCDVML